MVPRLRSTLAPNAISVAVKTMWVKTGHSKVSR